MKTVIIDIDSLRADQLGAYGQEQDISPNIDDLSEDSKIFTNAYVAGSPSMPSRASMLYGRFPVHHHVETHGTMGQTINHPYSWSFSAKKEWDGDLKEWWSLPEALFRNGVESCAVSSASRYPAPWMFNFWNRYIQPQEPEEDPSTFASVKAEKVVEHGLEFLEDGAEDDFFLYLQFWDPHMPMQRPEEEVEKFEDIDIPEYPTKEQIEEHQDRETKNSAVEKGVESREDLRELYAEYRAEINYVDQQIGRIIEYLKDEELYEDSLVILTADHGEEFGEHGVYQEHWSTNEKIQKIPLLVKPPEKDPDQEEFDDLVSNVDLAPTVLNYLDLQEPRKWQGRSLKPLIEEENFDWREFLVMDHGLHTAQKAIRDGKWKVIQTLHPGDFGKNLQEMQLYNVEEDPFEQENLALERSKLVEKLKTKMDLWREQRMHGSDPLKKVEERGPAGYRYLEHGFQEDP
ncbi:MAG: sulfatase [Candidatus Nanosalina sp.]